MAPKKAAAAPVNSLEAALDRIRKQYGGESIMLMEGEDRPAASVQVIPTGSIYLDHALGVGGYPRGRVVEIYGPESAGKTTVALHAVANAQRAGGIAAFIDAEHALTPELVRACGGDPLRLMVSQPSCGEEGLEICDTLVQSGQVDVIVVDSVAALTPRAEIEGMMGDSHMGLQARLMSQALRKITANFKEGNDRAVVIFINQLREKIGVLFGNPETTTGGKALKFYASLRLDVRIVERLKDGTDAYGNRLRVRVVKNKVSHPFRQAEFDLIFGRGISRAGELLDLGVDHGFIQKSGAYYTYGPQESRIALGNGKAAAKAFLDAHTPESAGIVIELEQLVYQALASTPLVAAPPPQVGTEELTIESPFG